MVVVLHFYKYVPVAHPRAYADAFKACMIAQGIRGRVLFANEGINGCVSLPPEVTQKFKEFVHAYKEFKGMVFKEDAALEHPFNKVQTKVRNEICKFVHPVNLKNTGNHLSPQELHEWYAKGKEFVIVDARNTYESTIGYFENAIKLELDVFHELPKTLAQIEAAKDREVVMYCTGGIRCEKASAFLKENGFTKVHQLDGGIISYLNEFPESKNWKGRCFVFDKRLTKAENASKVPLTKCSFCVEPCDKYINCVDVPCNNLVLVCDPCKIKNKGYCFACAQKTEMVVSLA